MTPHTKSRHARRIDEVGLEFLAASARIRQADGLALDRDAPFPLDVHVVEDLVPELAVVDEMGVLDETICGVDFPWSMWAMMLKFLICFIYELFNRLP